MLVPTIFHGEFIYGRKARVIIYKKGTCLQSSLVLACSGLETKDDKVGPKHVGDNCSAVGHITLTSTTKNRSSISLIVKHNTPNFGLRTTSTVRRWHETLSGDHAQRKLTPDWRTQQLGLDRKRFCGSRTGTACRHPLLHRKGQRKFPHQSRQGGRTHFMHNRTLKTMDPRIPATSGRSTSGFHRPGRHHVHQARSA